MNRVTRVFKQSPISLLLMRISERKYELPLSVRLLLGLVLFSGSSAVAGAAYLRFAPLPTGAIIDPSRVLTAQGQVLGDLVGSGITRQEVTLNQIPIALQEATIAVEDASFYAHYGLNFKGIVRALMNNLGAGHVVQGGSTITQQLAKNLFLTGDRTLWRKLREAVYALQLELHDSKQKILTDYLNVIYYGDGATGVGTASLYYFGKPVSQLTLAECALLAGIPKGPSLYAPLTHYDAAKERQRVVLQSMVRSGFITQRAAQAAFIQPLHFSHRAATESFAPYFTEAASQVAQKQFHLTQDDLYRGGLYLHTTLDSHLQAALDRAIAHYIPKSSGLQVAAVALDAQTGDVLAYSGGTNFRISPFDRVQARRQTGSAFKPFVYATALDNGFTAAAHIISQPTTFTYDGGQTYRVHNFADDYAYGPIDMKEAIARSDNVFAVRMNMAIGPASVEREAEAFGLPADMSPYPSLALGVFPASPLDLARAYTVFANGGQLVRPRFITTIDDASGTELYRTQPLAIRVLSPATAYIMTNMMQAVMKPGGTGFRVAQMIPGQVAAKTGTTDTDAWMVGYTPRTVCAVWVGFDRMRPINGVESHLAAPIFASVMKAAFEEKPQGDFTIPSSVTPVVIDPETGQRATALCPNSELDYFQKGSEPLTSCVTHPIPATSVGQQAMDLLRSAWSWITGR